MTHHRLFRALAATAALCLVPALPAAAQAQAGPLAEIDAPLPGKADRQVLAAQILLDRSRFSPGVIDGQMGGNTRRAIESFQRANGIPVTGAVSASLLERLRSSQPDPLLRKHKLTQEDVSGPFVDVPSGFEAMAELDALAFENAGEKLAERFHMAQSFLRALNPGASFTAGEEIWIVAVGNNEIGAKVARIEVDKAASALRAYDEAGKLLARYPATVGSADFPSPSGTMEVRAIAPTPKYYFNPEGREWGPNKNLVIAAGPNNPVGSTWIDLSKEGYGIHGTPDPALIGKTGSHGCVRLTNWDAEELAKAVGAGVKVEFL